MYIYIYIQRERERSLKRLSSSRRLCLFALFFLRRRLNGRFANSTRLDYVHNELMNYEFIH